MPMKRNLNVTDSVVFLSVIMTSVPVIVRSAWHKTLFSA